MKLLFFFVFTVSFASAQTKILDFFGTEFHVNNACEIKESSAKYDKNALMWTDAPPALMRGMILSTIKNKIKKGIKEIKTEELKVTLLKESWKGKHTLYKKDGNDSITNFIQLYGNYKSEERLLILIYRTPKQEPFRIPAYFDFLAR